MVEVFAYFAGFCFIAFIGSIAFAAIVSFVGEILVVGGFAVDTIFFKNKREEMAQKQWEEEQQQEYTQYVSVEKYKLWEKRRERTTNSYTIRLNNKIKQDMVAIARKQKTATYYDYNFMINN